MFLKPGGVDVVLERSVTVIPVEIRGVFDEVGLHQIEIAVAVKHATACAGFSWFLN
jgi:hypothetical protein